MTLSIKIAALAALVVVASPAVAVTVYNGVLNTANENNPLDTGPGMGYGTLTVSDDTNSISVNLAFSGLSAPSVAGHIHCCAPLGTNTGVAIPFTFTSGTAGTIISTFDLTSAATYTAGFVTANGGTVLGAQTAFLAGLAANQAYFNIHTRNFPGGEIRAQIGLVPEPATWGMMITGFGLVGGALRRRQATLATA